MSRFIESVFEKLKRHPKRIVFPEGTEPTVLRAAREFARLKLGTPILLGKRDAVEKAAKAERVKMDHIGVVDPVKLTVTVCAAVTDTRSPPAPFFVAANRNVPGVPISDAAGVAGVALCVTV